MALRTSLVPIETGPRKSRLPLAVVVSAAAVRSEQEMRVALAKTNRHVERRLPVSGLERCPACHPERSAGAGSMGAEILRYAQDDRPYLQISGKLIQVLT